MYRPCSEFRRSAKERADQMLSWNRRDQAFFASGACHILAFVFLELYPGSGFSTTGLWPMHAQDPSHVYVTDGTWAFDHDGWTPEAELIAITKAAEPDANYEPRCLVSTLADFCASHHHRPPHLFPFDPCERARRYIKLSPAPEEHSRAQS